MILATVILASTSPAAQQSSADAHFRAWLKPLQAVAKSEQAAMCVDVDGKLVPRLFHYPKREGMEGLDRLAVATGRSWTVVDGVYVFRRQFEFEDPRLQTSQAHAMAFLKSLDDESRIKLLEGALRLSHVPRRARRNLRFAVASYGEGLGDSLLAQFPGRVGMRLILEPTAVVLSRTGDGTVQLNLVAGSGTVPVPDDSFSDREPSPLGGPLDGDLDFGDGTILLLSDVALLARSTFGKQVLIDGRLADTHCFFSGRFTFERLLRVLGSVSETVVPQSVPEKRGLSALDINEFRALAFGGVMDQKVGAGELTYQSVFNGLQTTFYEIYGDRPPRRVRSFMSQYRIQPTDTVSVSGEMSLAFAAPGLAAMPTDIRDIRGNMINANVPHFLKLSFYAAQ